jgi:enamine deaminase RidA (YjgF/YER057c/UK114 family)
MTTRQGFSSSGTFSNAVLVGDVLHVSGQVPLGPDGQLVGEGDAHAQAVQVFENIAAALAEAGMTMDDLVTLRCFMVSLDDYPAYAEVKARFVTGDPPPTGTAIAVSGTLVPGGRFEVEAVAVRRT